MPLEGALHRVDLPRMAAQELVAQGYAEHEPDLTAATTAAPVTFLGQTEITV